MRRLGVRQHSAVTEVSESARNFLFNRTQKSYNSQICDEIQKFTRERNLITNDVATD